MKQRKKNLRHQLLPKLIPILWKLQLYRYRFDNSVADDEASKFISKIEHRHSSMYFGHLSSHRHAILMWQKMTKYSSILAHAEPTNLARCITTTARCITLNQTNSRTRQKRDIYYANVDYISLRQRQSITVSKCQKIVSKCLSII
jgi:DNA topoisomerase VI subunit A